MAGQTTVHGACHKDVPTVQGNKDKKDKKGVIQELPSA